MKTIRRVPPLVSSAINAGKFCLPFSHAPMAQNGLAAPFFIVGCGRSGNTLLRRLLAAHSAVHIPPENSEMGRAIIQYKQLNHRDWRLLVRVVLSAIEYNEAFETFDLKSLSQLAIQLNYLPKEQRSLASILDAFYRFHAAETGSSCAIWGDKTPYLTFYMKEIHQTFPNVKFIHILRDGADVVASYVNSKVPLPTHYTLDELRNRLPFLKKLLTLPHEREYGAYHFAAHLWNDANKTIDDFAKKHPSAVHLVRYETLVEEPEETLQSVCDYLDIAFEASMVADLGHVGGLGDVGKMAHHTNVTKPISTKSIGKGRASLLERSEVIEELRPTLQNTLPQYGYDVL